MTTLTEEETLVLNTRLKEAEAAYHVLRMGGQPRVVVDQNGERVEFAVANSDRLRSYILELRGQLGLPSGIIGPLNAWVKL